MNQYTVFGLFYLLQNNPDYGGWLAPALAAVAAIVTVYSQIRMKRLDTEIASAHLKNDAQAQVTEAWKQFSLNQSEELKDVRRRLGLAEAHTRICERGQINLILQLVEAGVKIDFTTILGEMNASDQHSIDRDEMHISIDPHSSMPPAAPAK